MTTAVAVAALLTALAALTLAAIVMRQSSRALGTLRRHRLAHQRAEGSYDPEPYEPPDREPRGTDRGRYAPPTGHMPAVPPPPERPRVRENPQA